MKVRIKAQLGQRNTSKNPSNLVFFSVVSQLVFFTVGKKTRPIWHKCVGSCRAALDLLKKAAKILSLDWLEKFYSNISKADTYACRIHMAFRKRAVLWLRAYYKVRHCLTEVCHTDMLVRVGVGSFLEFWCLSLENPKIRTTLILSRPPKKTNLSMCMSFVPTARMIRTQSEREGPASNISFPFFEWAADPVGVWINNLDEKKDRPNSSTVIDQ